MSHKSVFALLSIAFIALFVLMQGPVAHAADDALKVSGTLLTVDTNAKTVTVKKNDNSRLTLKYAAATDFERNGKHVKVKALTLGDSIQAKYKSNLTATKIEAKGQKVKAIAGKLTSALKASGTVVVNGKTLQTTASTRISRNGMIVSLSQLTREDTLVAHVRVVSASAAGQTQEALDLISEGPDDGEVHGTISAIAGSAVTITPDNGTAAVTVNVTDTTMIERNGEAAALADLTVGDAVEAEYDPTSFNAFSIEANSHGEQQDAHINGTVAALDAGAGTVTIHPGTGADVTVVVDSATEIKVNHEAATFADIQVGMPIEADYDLATLHARDINAGSGDDNHEDSHVEGTVAAVDTGAATVTINPNGGGATITLNVTTETRLEVNDEPGTLADIHVGAQIQAEYDPSTMNASEIKSGSEHGGGGGEESQVEGSVTAVDIGAATVTIQPVEGNPVAVNVTSDTQIEVKDGAGTIADITVGMHVHAKYDPTTLNAMEIKSDSSGDGGNGGHQGGEIQGSVSAVDTGASTVTITPTSGSPVTLTVNGDTEIKVNGQHATLADVTVGQPAKAEYDATSLVARELNVGTDSGD